MKWPNALSTWQLEIPIPHHLKFMKTCMKSSSPRAEDILPFPLERTSANSACHMIYAFGPTFPRRMGFLLAAPLASLYSPGVLGSRTSLDKETPLRGGITLSEKRALKVPGIWVTIISRCLSGSSLPAGQSGKKCHDGCYLTSPLDTRMYWTPRAYHLRSHGTSDTPAAQWGYLGDLKQTLVVSDQVISDVSAQPEVHILTITKYEEIIRQDCHYLQAKILTMPEVSEKNFIGDFGGTNDGLDFIV